MLRQAKEVPPGSKPGAGSFWTLTLGSIGVVYGDIGTSPLYAIKESLNAAKGSEALSSEMIFGVLSLTLWALIIVVTLKYVIVILRADNNGDHGRVWRSWGCFGADWIWRAYNDHEADQQGNWAHV